MNDNIVKVVGKQVVDFVNKETGEMIKGISLFVLVEDERVIGYKATKQFIGVNSPAYDSASALNLANGSLDCIFNYAFKVGQKTPTLLSVEVA
ncbi:MAG: hypothetical protein E7195_07545 [Peptococcaceae bacterium]|nr:hypothetical protein [Peptococcaceae bacterium]